MNFLAIPSKIEIQLSALRRELDAADTCKQALNIGGGASGLEEAMRKSGFGEIEAIRPARELFLDSRWVLGKLLAKVLRVPRGNNAKKTKSQAETSFRDELDRIGLNKDRAVEAQRIGTLPPEEKNRTYAEAKNDGVLPTISLLVDVARPFWYRAKRKARHQAIRDDAREAEELIGPFALVYADPPWKFATYSEKGLERAPDQHYPTLSDQEIIDFEIQGRSIDEITTKDAALLLWCTSSNMHRALAVMDAWGFEFKSSAVWVKTKKNGGIWTGTGLVFRNAHEILLYGTRGNMPGPQWQPPSVLLAERLRHSEKPPEMRKRIERMYPDFDERTRLELFAREGAKGWTGYGYEAHKTD